MWKRSWIKRRNGQAEEQKENQNGLAEGERAKQLEIAKNLINIGMKVEDIIKVTGLSKEEIENLIKEKEHGMIRELLCQIINFKG